MKLFLLILLILIIPIPIKISISYTKENYYIKIYKFNILKKQNLNNEEITTKNKKEKPYKKFKKNRKLEISYVIEIIKALNKNGILYCSFKYGDKEIKGERYFNYINENIINKIIDKNKLCILEMYKSFDVRKDRSTEEWLNIIIKSKD